MYCNPSDPNFENYKWEFNRARRAVKIELKDDKENNNFEDNLLFVCSTTQTLIPVLKLPKDEPTLITIIPVSKIEDEVNLLQEPWYLQSLKVIDGIPRDEFIHKQTNPDPDLQDKPEDDEKEKHWKENDWLWFSEERFRFQKIFKLNKEFKAENMIHFVKNI